MNQTKTKYALERVNQIFNAKLDRIRTDCTKGEDGPSVEMRATLIKQGKVKIKPSVTKINKYTDVCEVFDFSKFETKTVFDEKKYNEKVNKLTIEMETIKDEIVLGDEEKALRLLEKFSEK